MTLQPFICGFWIVLFKFNCPTSSNRAAESLVTIRVVGFREDVRDFLAEERFGVGSKNGRSLVVEKCKLPLVVEYQQPLRDASQDGLQFLVCFTNLLFRSFSLRNLLDSTAEAGRLAIGVAFHFAACCG